MFQILKGPGQGWREVTVAGNRFVINSVSRFLSIDAFVCLTHTLSRSERCRCFLRSHHCYARLRISSIAVGLASADASCLFLTLVGHSGLYNTVKRQ